MLNRLLRLAVIPASAALIAGADGARAPIRGPISAHVVEVIDGDTVTVRARIWLGQEVETRVRLAGVDAPELRGRCENERRLALEARRFVEARIGGAEIVLLDIRYGKYAGRVVARVRETGGAELAQALIRRGLARPYRGGARISWCGGSGARVPERRKKTAGRHGPAAPSLR